MNYNNIHQFLIQDIKRREKEIAEVEMNRIDEQSWNNWLTKFYDASLYQTWGYGLNNTGGRNIDHIVLKVSGKVKSMVQVRILTLPVLKRGIAYIYWGPVWQLKDEDYNEDFLEQTLMFLFSEYVIKRKLMLRIIPGIWEDDKNKYDEMFNRSGLKLNPGKKKERTIIIDLSIDYNEIRKNFRPNTRRDLQNSEKKELEILSGTGEDHFQIFNTLYDELLKFKMIPIPSNIQKYIKIQNSLPEKLKMRIFICKHENKPVAAIVGTNIGRTGIILFSATNSEGRKLKATYLLQWEMIKWLKESGCRWYDLGGIDQKSNPGCFRFKSGLGGRIINYVGQYESCQNNSSRIITELGEYIRRIKPIVTHIVNKND